MGIAELQGETVSEEVQRCRRLALVLGMTREMLTLADNGEWEQVAQRELERREDLMACFSESAPIGDADLVAEALAALLHLNEELMERLKTARTAVMAQGRDLAASRKAVGSYRAVNSAL